jgi:hypothetical protein
MVCPLVERVPIESVQLAGFVAIGSESLVKFCPGVARSEEAVYHDDRVKTGVALHFRGRERRDVVLVCRKIGLGTRQGAESGEESGQCEKSNHKENGKVE